MKIQKKCVAVVFGNFPKSIKYVFRISHFFHCQCCGLASRPFGLGPLEEAIGPIFGPQTTSKRWSKGPVGC